LVHLELVQSDVVDKKNAFSDEGRIYVLHLARIFFFLVLNLFTYVLDFSNAQFINSNFDVYTQMALCGSFLTTSILFFNWDKLFSNKNVNSGILILDVLFIFAFIHFTGFIATQYVFLYLGIIVLSGLILTLDQSLFIAGLACLLFNINLASTSGIETNQVFSFILNNFSFLITAYLSASLGKHLTEVNVELKKKETEIEHVKNINSLIVDNISSGIITTKPGGEIFSINESAKNIIGQLSSEKNINKIFSFDQSQPAEVGRLESTINVGEDKKILELIYSPLKNSDGEDKGNIYLIQDLTKQKKLEYAVRQQDKMAAVGQLAAGIAHEIRNPLASISGSVQLLESTSSDPENSKLFKIILREIDRLNDLITEFLEFVRPDKVNEEPMDLNLLIDELVKMLKFNKTVRQDVSIDLQLNSERNIHGDSSKLKQALLNITLNAMQAMNDVDVAKLSIKTYDENDKVVLSITDTGIGIKPETLNKIFEPFHTTKPKGTGLGLAITHKILENHEAEVFVESELGKGTQFTIAFPAKGDLFPKEMKALKMA